MGADQSVMAEEQAEPWAAPVPTKTIDAPQGGATAIAVPLASANSMPSPKPQATGNESNNGSNSPVSVVTSQATKALSSPANAKQSPSSRENKIVPPLSSLVNRLSWRKQGWKQNSGNKTPMGSSSRGSLDTTNSHADPKQVFEGMDGISLQAALNHITQLKQLISTGAYDVNKTDSDGDRTPLHWAACRDYLECVKLLVEVGADTSALDSRGMTPAALAYEVGAMRAHNFLTYGPAKEDPKEIQPGMLDAVSLQGALNHRRQLKELLKTNDPNQQDGDGDRYPLHWAAARGNYECILILLSAGADMNARDSAGRTAAELARELNQRGTFELLQQEVNGTSIHCA